MDQDQLAQVIASAVAQALQQQQQLERPRETAAALKVELKDFNGKQEDWEDWRIEHLAKAEALGFADALNTDEGHDIMVGAEGFDASDVDPVRLRQARQAWTSLITTCKGTARDLVKSEESPGGAWRLLNEHYRASGLKEKRRLAEEFNSMKMEIGEHPREFITRVDNAAKELRRLGKTVDEDDIVVVILNGVSSEYDTEVRLLECGDDVNPPRSKILRSLTNQYNRLQKQKSDAGGKALYVTAQRSVVATCQLCHKPGHTADQCFSYRITKAQSPNPKGQRAEEGIRHEDTKKPKPRRCYVCGEAGHMARNCPQRKDRSGESSKGGKSRTLIARSVCSKNKSATPGVTVSKPESDRFESWSADSGATEHMTPDATALKDYKPAAPGDVVEIADNNFLRTAGYGQLEMELMQPGGIMPVTLKKVAHVPALGRNLLSTRRASESSGEPFVNYPNKAQLGLGKNTICTFRLGESGLFEVMGRRRDMKDKALSSRALSLRGVMEMHRLLGHPSEQITRETAKQLGVELSGQWTPCEACSMAKARRNAVPKSTNTRSTQRAGRFFVDLGGSMPTTSLGGSKYVMICVDDFSRFKIVRFLKKKSDAAAALRNIIAEYITPSGLKVGAIRTDEGGEFEGEFQRVLDSFGINHEFTPPDTPQYNGVAERALGLLREKSIAMLQEMTVAASDRLWAEAMNYACDMSNMCVTSSLEGGTSPYEKWYGEKPSLQHVRPFGTVGYARRGKRAHKLAPKGEKCIMLGLAHNHPRDTVKVLIVRSGEVVHRQNISWHPEPVPCEPRTPISTGDMKEAMPIGVAGGSIEAYTVLESDEERESEDRSEPSESPGPTGSQHSDSGAEPLEQSAFHQPVAMRKLADHFTGELPSVLPRRTRGGGGDDRDEGESSFSCISRKHGRESLSAMLAASGAKPHPLVEEKTNDLIALQAASTLPPGIADLLPNEPSTIREAQASPEWLHWKGALEREMDGQINNGVWVQVERPKGKTVLGTKTLFKRKIGKDGQVEKYKCRFVTQGFRQIKGLHYHESFSPTPTAASMRAVLATAAVEDWELRHIDVEQAYLQADIDEEIYIELPEEYRAFPNAVGLLRKAIYGLVQSGLCWYRKFTDSIKEKGFEQSHADPCLFRRFVDGEVKSVIVVYVDDVLLASKSKEDEERTISDLRSCFKIKDLGEAEFYLGCHITRDRKERTLTFDQHIYAETVAKRFNVSKTSMIPTATGVKALSKEDGPKNSEERGKMSRVPYREAVGALMWAATMTRPDLSFAAHNLAKFCDDPGPVHWEAVMKALQYFWRTKNLGITYGGGTSNDTKMSAYVDSDHATCPDSRRSVSGGAVLLGSGAISWFSRAQRVTASASSESEYVALAEIVNETKFLRQVQEFILPNLRSYAIPIMEDNQGAIKMANNKHSSRRTRHIDVKHHVVRDAVEEGVVRIVYVRSEDQHADILTKALDMRSFESHAKVLMNAK